MVVDSSPAKLRADLARDRLDTPLYQREWLTAPEAAAVVAVSLSTIRNWLRAGLLPNTQRGGRRYLYLRADLLRVDRGRRYNDHGADFAAVREQIEQSSA